MPNRWTLLLAVIIVLVLALASTADARGKGGKKVRLCELRGPCLVVTLPAPGQCRDIFGYWICHGRPRR